MGTTREPLIGGRYKFSGRFSGVFRPEIDPGTPLIYDFLTGRKSAILGGLGGPGRPGDLPKRWGGEERTPRQPGAAQTY